MIITLCGSAKFEKEFHEWNERLTLSGHCVFSLAVFPSSKNGDKNWYDEAIKQTLDLAHFHKIDASEGIVVINPGQYIGFSTAREIEWAKRKSKEVFYTHPPEANDSNIEYLLRGHWK